MDLTKNKESFNKRYHGIQLRVTSLIGELSKNLSREEGIKLQLIKDIYSNFLKDLSIELYGDLP